MVQTLLGYLKLAALHQPAAFVKKLVDVHAAGKIGKVYACTFGQVALFKHLTPQDGVKNLKGITLFVSLLKIEVDNGCGRIWIKAYNRGLQPWRRSGMVLLGLGEKSCSKKRRYK